MWAVGLVKFLAVRAPRSAISAVAELLLKLNGPSDTLMSDFDDRAGDCSLTVGVLRSSKWCRPERIPAVHLFIASVLRRIRTSTCCKKY